MFGASAAKPSLFGGFGAPSQQQQQQQQQPAQQSTGLFRSLGASQQQQQQQQPRPSLFGGLGQSQPQQQPQAQTQQTGSLFGSIGQQQQPTPQQQASLYASQFGGSQLGGSTSQLPKLGQSSIWEPPQQGPREKSVPEQLSTILEKWHPESPNCLFQFYFYNNVDPRVVPFYTPGPGEDERKWEEALSKKPSEGSIPVLAKGFKAVATRLSLQSKTVQALQVRLHEINNSLSMMMQKHELEWTVKIAEAKRRHISMSQRALALATKVQVLRNRGYSMESSEEELRKKLVELEKKAFDPVANGRQEEIWARLSTLRQQVQWLQTESEKLGNQTAEGDDGVDAEKMKQVEQILKDYKSQLDHLEKEVGSLKTEFDDWQGKSQNLVNGR